MKIVERVSKGLVIWILVSLLLKCSVTTFDLLSAIPKVSYEERGEALKAPRGSKV